MIDLVNFDNTTRRPDGVSVHAGFPNAGSEANDQALNLQYLLVPRPISTFLFRISGNEWARYGVFDNDIAVIDRALTPNERDLVIWWHADFGEFSLTRRSAMPKEAAVWGCVTSLIHQTRRAV